MIGIKNRIALTLMLLVSTVPPAISAEKKTATQPAEPLKIVWGPYLQNVTPRSVTLLWTAGEPTEGAVEFEAGEPFPGLCNVNNGKAVIRFMTSKGMLFDTTRLELTERKARDDKAAAK